LGAGGGGGWVGGGLGGPIPGRRLKTHLKASSLHGTFHEYCKIKFSNNWSNEAILNVDHPGRLIDFKINLQAHILTTGICRVL
jgi:hypothetical protein